MNFDRFFSLISLFREKKRVLKAVERRREAVIFIEAWKNEIYLILGNILLFLMWNIYKFQAPCLSLEMNMRGGRGKKHQPWLNDAENNKEQNSISYGAKVLQKFWKMEKLVERYDENQFRYDRIEWHLRYQFLTPKYNE
jgi:hypothetical protein